MRFKVTENNECYVINPMTNDKSSYEKRSFSALKVEAKTDRWFRRKLIYLMSYPKSIIYINLY